jgi:RsiW-degrading membrane proteinase PrsW (M82 family)
MIKRPGGALTGSKTPSKSQLFPFMSNWPEVRTKTYLFPALITVVCVVALFATIGTVWYLWLFAFYLTGAGYYFIYRLCGKSKPWWVLAVTTIATALILISPLLRAFIFVFREILPGNVSTDGQTNFTTQLIGMFFGAGLMEELLKALPVFALYWLGTRLRSPARERVGVWEPLDGILLGAASAAGFTLIETMLYYVPKILTEVAQQAGEGAGLFVALQLLIPRIIGSVCGHMAYSGYFGYFIGLSVLKPESRWLTLGIGYLTAAGLHALWNSSESLGVGFFVVVGSLSYILLAAAILKARQISPTRAQNFATQVIGVGVSSRFSLQVQGRTTALYLGTKLREPDIPGLKAQTGHGVVAEVNSNPNDPSVLGLKNLSGIVWTVMTGGRTYQLNAGQSVRLAPGTKIDFGPTRGTII